MTAKLTPHPLTDTLGMLSEDELLAMAENIESNGQQSPIIVWKGKNLIVDGRNRLAACELVGVTPWIEEVEFADDMAVLRHIESAERRRHQSKSQRAMWGARLANMPQGRPTEKGHQCPSITIDAAVRICGAGARSIKSARYILKANDPALIAKVDAGAMTVKEAERVLRQREKPPETPQPPSPKPQPREPVGTPLDQVKPPEDPTAGIPDAYENPLPEEKPMDVHEMPVHLLARILEKDDYKVANVIAKTIRKGARPPVFVWRDQLVYSRNLLSAYDKAKVTPVVEVIEEEDPEEVGHLLLGKVGEVSETRMKLLAGWIAANCSGRSAEKIAERFPFTYKAFWRMMPVLEMWGMYPEQVAVNVDMGQIMNGLLDGDISIGKARSWSYALQMAHLHNLGIDKQPVPDAVTRAPMPTGNPLTDLENRRKLLYQKAPLAFRALAEGYDRKDDVALGIVGRLGGIKLVRHLAAKHG